MALPSALQNTEGIESPISSHTLQELRLSLNDNKSYQAILMDQWTR